MIRIKIVIKIILFMLLVTSNLYCSDTINYSHNLKKCIDSTLKSYPKNKQNQIKLKQKETKDLEKYFQNTEKYDEYLLIIYGEIYLGCIDATAASDDMDYETYNLLNQNLK